MRYSCADAWKWRGRFADVSVRRCKYPEVREKIYRKKEKRKKEREGVCEGMTMWMYRCDIYIDVWACGGGEVDLRMLACEDINAQIGVDA